jgi:hypothetical protein
MMTWTIEAELALVPTIWLLLRLIDEGARVTGQWLRSGFARLRYSESHRPAYRSAGIGIGANLLHHDL